ncbi:hypothetical protein BDN70DRAFT_882307 [Pholiota conissans]|uniref:Diphthine--ammonia ligase n=1 Tax=Pholiota conissans TaxID=109636 RepID=A0A9P6CXD4_9AGAR|nr:hypothetical protein BDN70DRAFT_882307 [Pholiota conissans]
MQYLALLSGGKDSCYNLVHCAHNGHELVAAASLGPEPGKEELDSYLYQTVGQDAIEFVAQALDVPLYRRIITGNAVEQGSEYGGRNPTSSGGVTGDETEDLYELLATVKVHYPDVKGVSVGAILSNYQRVRVEHVCRRLDLTPLCFLWQRDQGELLSEMIESGMEAILIKVAGIGLTTSHLGKTLGQMKPTLFKLNTLYGSHICGEGGEYETLTLDCSLFRDRIRVYVTETETVIHSDNDFATVAFLRIKSADLQEKSTTVGRVIIPSLLDEAHESIRVSILNSENPSARDSKAVSRSAQEPSIKPASSLKKGRWVVVSNIQIVPPETAIAVEEEVVQCFRILAKQLSNYSLSLTQIAIINIFISSMDLFLRVNAVYTKFFGVSPPARACVGVVLPDGIHVKLDCIAFSDKTPLDRQSLHVQSLSYWAPANIGPYSQAITVGERVFISGQIGLIPSRQSLPTPQSLAMETALASQHVSRVVGALRENSGGGWVGYTQLSIYWLVHSDEISQVKAGHSSIKPDIPSPTLFLAIEELPKDALVEKQVIVHTGQCEVIDEYDGERAVAKSRPIYEEGDDAFETGCALHWEVSRFVEDGAACAVIFIRGSFVNRVPDLKRATPKLSSVLESTLSMRLFYTPTITSTNLIEQLEISFFEGQSIPPTTPIFCHAISSSSEDDWDMALCLVTSSNIAA